MSSKLKPVTRLILAVSLASMLTTVLGPLVSGFVPAAAAPVGVASAVGGQHTLLLGPAGSVWGLGDDYFGEIGIAKFVGVGGPTPITTVPVRVAGLPPAVAVAAGDRHSVVLDVTGHVWTFGANDSGQLGVSDLMGTLGGIAKPTEVSGLDQVVGISAGNKFTLALRSDGSVWIFGLDFDWNVSPVPRQVPGMSGVAAVSAGAFHALALRSDGTVYGVGLNGAGQAGQCQICPTQVGNLIGGLTGAVAVSAGGSQSLVLRSDGTVWGFGRNAEGQTGSPVYDIHQFIPAMVPGITTAVGIRAGNGFGVALLRSGAVLAFGQNRQGQLGSRVGFGTWNPVPPTVVPGLPDAVSLSTGFGGHTVVVRSDGSFWGFGLNLQGALGYGFDGGFEARVITWGTLPGQSITPAAAGLPASATQALVNLTMVDGGSPGYLTADQCSLLAAGPQTKSNGNFDVSMAIANLSVVPLDSDGRFCLYNSAPVNEVADVQGYFAPPGPGGLMFVPVIPSRLLDTRAAPLARPAAATITRVETGVAAGTAAVVVNLTMADGAMPGYITADKCSSLSPGAQTKSSGNHGVGAAIANVAVVPVDPDGSFCIFNQQPVNLIVDVQGSFSSSANGALGFTALTPSRKVDTRIAPATQPTAGTITRVDTGLAIGTSAVLVNLTMTEGGAPGYVSADKCSAVTSGPQSKSSGNFVATTAIANLAVVSVDADGSFCIFNSQAVSLVVDLQGSFSPTGSQRFFTIAPRRVLDTR